MNEIEFRQTATFLDLTKGTNRTYRAVVFQGGKKLYCSVYNGSNVLSPLKKNIVESHYAKEMAWRLVDLAKRLKGERFYMEDNLGNIFELDQKTLARSQRKEK